MSWPDPADRGGGGSTLHPQLKKNQNIKHNMRMFSTLVHWGRNNNSVVSIWKPDKWEGPKGRNHNIKEGPKGDQSK